MLTDVLSNFILINGTIESEITNKSVTLGQLRNISTNDVKKSSRKTKLGVINTASTSLSLKLTPKLVDPCINISQGSIELLFSGEES